MSDGCGLLYLCQSGGPGGLRGDAPAQSQAMSTLVHHSLRRPGISLLSHKPATPSPLCPSEAQGEGRSSSSKATCNRCRRLPNCPSSHPWLKVPLVVLSLWPGVQGGFHPIPLLPVPVLPPLRNCFCQRNPSALCWVGLWFPEELTGVGADPWLWANNSQGIAIQPS